MKKTKKIFWINVNDNGTMKAIRITATIVRIDEDTFIYFDKNCRKWIVMDEKTGLNFGSRWMNTNLEELYTKYTQDNKDKDYVENYRKTERYKTHTEEFKTLIAQEIKENESNERI